MHRRTLLKGAAALPVVALLSAALSAVQARARSLLRRVRPGDAGWPTAASWQKLKDAVGDNLIAVHSLFGACEKEPGAAACLEATENIHNPFYIGDQPAGTQVSGWLDAWTPAPSVYALKARHTADVVAGVNFARHNKLRLVVKGTGHSYQGTSNAADSLLIWTRAMNQVTVHEAFVASGCEGKAPAVPAVSAGAGAMWIDLYHAVTSRAGRYVQGGGCTTVGVAGLVQSGGFGSHSKGFGTAASGLLEAEVVTADGGVRTVNACTHPDLFWAIKGGGGGSWGVITRLTLRTHELPEHFGAAWGTIKAQSDDAFRRLLSTFIEFYAGSLFNPHWGEQVSIGSGNTLKLSMVSQGLDRQHTQQLWEPFFSWVNATPQDFTVTDAFGTGAIKARLWWDPAAGTRMVPDTRAGAPAHHAWWQGDQEQVGAYLHGYDSLWLPAALLQEPQRQRLAEALFAGSRHKEIGLHFNKGLAGAPPEAIAAALDTATNPAVTEAFALAIIADGEGAAYPGLARPAMDLAAAHEDARAIDRATAELRRIAPLAGSYVSESNYFNAQWSRAFWGKHYPRLRAIKAKYDPDGLFFVHHGVGSEGWSADGFTPMSHSPAPAPGAACAGLALALLLLSAALHGATPANEVPRKPLTSAEVLAASTAADWRALDPSNTLYLELPSGRVVIELAPQFAPHHVANVQALARGHYFDGLWIMRAQDNYVVQWGDPDGKKPVGAAHRTVGAEFERPLRGLSIMRFPDPDTYAPEVGFVDTFPIAADPAIGRAWLVHCYGMVGAGRDNDVDSGGGTELYVVIGQAPRHLDRNVTLLGRVVSGIELLSVTPRGSGTLGFYEHAEQRTPLKSLRLAADVPAAQRTELEVLRTDTPTFLAYAEARRSRHEEWFKVPAARLDVCNVTIPVRPRTNGGATK